MGEVHIVNLLSKEGIIELYKKYSKDLEVITCLIYGYRGLSRCLRNNR